MTNRGPQKCPLLATSPLLVRVLRHPSPLLDTQVHTYTHTQRSLKVRFKWRKLCKGQTVYDYLSVTSWGKIKQSHWMSHADLLALLPIKSPSSNAVASAHRVLSTCSDEHFTSCWTLQSLSDCSLLVIYMAFYLIQIWGVSCTSDSR